MVPAEGPDGVSQLLPPPPRPFLSGAPSKASPLPAAPSALASYGHLTAAQASRLEEEVDSLRKETSRLRVDLSTSLLDVTVARTDANEARKEAGALSAALHDARRALAVAERTIHESRTTASEEIERANAIYQDSQARLRTLEAAAAASAEALREAAATKEALQAAVASLRQELRESNEAADRLRAEKSRLAIECDAQKAELDRMRTGTSTAVASVREAYETALAEQKNRYESEISAVKQQLQVLAAEAAEYSAACGGGLQDIRGQRAKHEAELLRQQAEHSAALKTLRASCEREVEDLRAGFAADLAAERRSRESQLLRLEEERQRLLGEERQRSEAAIVHAAVTTYQHLAAGGASSPAASAAGASPRTAHLGASGTARNASFAPTTPASGYGGYSTGRVNLPELAADDVSANLFGTPAAASASHFNASALSTGSAVGVPFAAQLQVERLRKQMVELIETHEAEITEMQREQKIAIQDLQASLREAHARADSKEAEITALLAEHQVALSAAASRARSEGLATGAAGGLSQGRSLAAAELEAAHESERQSIRERCEMEIAALKRAHADTLSRLEASFAVERRQSEATERELRQRLDQASERAAEETRTLAERLNKRTLEVQAAHDAELQAAHQTREDALRALAVSHQRAIEALRNQLHAGHAQDMSRLRGEQNSSFVNRTVTLAKEASDAASAQSAMVADLTSKHLAGLRQLKESHSKDVRALRESLQQEAASAKADADNAARALESLRSQHSIELARIRAQHMAELEEMDGRIRSAHEAGTKALEVAEGNHRVAVAAIKSHHASDTAALEAEINALKAAHAEFNNSLREESKVAAENRFKRETQEREALYAQAAAEKARYEQEFGARERSLTAQMSSLESRYAALASESDRRLVQAEEDARVKTAEAAAAHQRGLEYLSTQHSSAVASLKTEHDAELMALRAEHAAECAKLVQAHAQATAAAAEELEATKASMQETIATLTAAAEERLRAAEARSAEEMRGLRADFERDIKSLQATHQQRVVEMETNIARLNSDALDASRMQDDSHRHTIEALQEAHARNLASARVELAEAKARLESERSALAASRSVVDAKAAEVEKAQQDLDAFKERLRDECARESKDTRDTCDRALALARAEASSEREARMKVQAEVSSQIADAADRARDATAAALMALKKELAEEREAHGGQLAKIMAHSETSAAQAAASAAAARTELERRCNALEEQKRTLDTELSATRKRAEAEVAQLEEEMESALQAAKKEAERALTFLKEKTEREASEAASTANQRLSSALSSQANEFHARILQLQTRVSELEGKIEADQAAHEEVLAKAVADAESAAKTSEDKHGKETVLLREELEFERKRNLEAHAAGTAPNVEDTLSKLAAAVGAAVEQVYLAGNVAKEAVESTHDALSQALKKALETTVTAYESELRDMKQFVRAQFDDIDAKREAFTAHMDELEMLHAKELARLRAEKDEALSELQEETKSLMEAKEFGFHEKIAELSSKLLTVEGDFSAATHALKEARQRIIDLSDALAGLKKTTVSVTDYEMLQGQLDIANSRVTYLAQQLSAAAVDLEKAAAGLDWERHTIVHYKSMAERAEDDRDQIMREVDAAANSLVHMQNSQEILSTHYMRPPGSPLYHPNQLQPASPASASGLLPPAMQHSIASPGGSDFFMHSRTSYQRSPQADKAALVYTELRAQLVSTQTMLAETNRKLDDALHRAASAEIDSDTIAAANRDLALRNQQLTSALAETSEMVAQHRSQLHMTPAQIAGSEMSRLRDLVAALELKAKTLGILYLSVTRQYQSLDGLDEAIEDIIHDAEVIHLRGDARALPFNADALRKLSLDLARAVGERDYFHARLEKERQARLQAEKRADSLVSRQKRDIQDLSKALEQARRASLARERANEPSGTKDGASVIGNDASESDASVEKGKGARKSSPSAESVRSAVSGVLDSPSLKKTPAQSLEMRLAAAGAPVAAPAPVPAPAPAPAPAMMPPATPISAPAPGPIGGPARPPAPAPATVPGPTGGPARPPAPAPATVPGPTGGPPRPPAPAPGPMGGPARPPNAAPVAAPKPPSAPGI
jgi:hypothetical protein